MRIFVNFKEALNEIERDLAEMGIDVYPETMQDKVVKGNSDYATKELQNYCYTVHNALNSILQLNPSQPWADAEFEERIYPKKINPGRAWEHRKEVWAEFLHDGRFAYTYNGRMYFQLRTIIHELRQHPNSRQLYLSIWDPSIDPKQLGGQSRVPCSLGYLIQQREGKINLTYTMRSCDFHTHLQNDLYLATRLMEYIADAVEVQPGNLTHFIGSLHVYAKDVKGVF